MLRGLSIAGHSAASRARQTANDGLTLIEVIVVIAILGLLAAVLFPTVTGILGSGEESKLASDLEAVNTATAEFTLDKHAGPDSSKKWGQEDEERFYPTEDGEVGDLELNPDEEDAGHPGNLRIDEYDEGAGTNGAANDSQIDDSLVWMGLLVNEPDDDSSNDQKKPGSARPQGGEGGEYLFEFPPTAHEDNTERDSGDPFTDGSYHYVVLHNGLVAGAYKSGTDWYAGYNNVYP